MNSITDIKARIITNSRGHDSIEVTVETSTGPGTFAVPEGASTGSNEVHTISAAEAVSAIDNSVTPHLRGMDIADQETLDAALHEIDDTGSFSKIGGNTAIGVSVACVKAAAAAQGIETWQHLSSLSKRQGVKRAPRLVVNLINGGKHAPYGSPIQEHQIIPETDDASVAYAVAQDIQEKLEAILHETYGADAVGKGDEGGFVIPSTSVFEPFTYLQHAIEAAKPDVRVYIGADIAASSFFNGTSYSLEGKKDTQGLLSFYEELFLKVPNLLFIEDPFFEADFDSFAALQAQFPKRTVIGDDLTVTNSALLKKAINAHAITALIIKPNQIGTVSDTLACIDLAHAHDVRTIVSHRSGETMDDFIADLAFATGSFGIKAGAPHTPERDAKYRRLINIEQHHYA